MVGWQIKLSFVFKYESFLYDNEDYFLMIRKRNTKKRSQDYWRDWKNKTINCYFH